jgi:hypothetical protein
MIVSTLVTTLALLAPGSGRAYTAGRFALDLDGAVAGWITEVSGGQSIAIVNTDKPGSDGIARKHIAGVKYEDIAVTCGSNMGKPMYDWIQSSFDHKSLRETGSVVIPDGNFKSASILDFSNAPVSEFGIQALDAAAKDAAKMTIKFKPELTRIELGGTSPKKKLVEDPVPFTDFVFQMPDFPGTHVQAMSRIKVRFPTFPDSGEFTRMSNVVITIPESEAGPFQQWYNDFVIKGNNDDSKHKNGSLAYISPSARVQLNLGGVGIVAVGPEDPYFNSTHRFCVELYVETCSFAYQLPKNP